MAKTKTSTVVALSTTAALAILAGSASSKMSRLRLANSGGLVVSGSIHHEPCNDAVGSSPLSSEQEMGYHIARTSLDAMLLSKAREMSTLFQNETSDLSDSGNNAGASSVHSKKDRIGSRSNAFSYIQYAPLPAAEQPLETIAFGSCIDQTIQDHTFWDGLVEASPDITILSGDTVYADCSSEECDELLEAYHSLTNHPDHTSSQNHGHEKFLPSVAQLPVIATLDDNDYGMDNAFVDNPYKDKAKEIFLSFFQVPRADPRWTQPDGVYFSRTFGDYSQGTAVQVIVLDTRYSRSAFTLQHPGHPHGGFEPNHNRDNSNSTKTNNRPTMLGDTQWDWLEQQFLHTSANLRLVVSSIQILAEGHPFECWRMLPDERVRLLRLIGRPDVVGTSILLTGDRHVGGFYAQENPLSFYNKDTSDGVIDEDTDFINGPTSDNSHNQAMIYEITSSSLTHTTPLGVHCRTPGGTTSEECDEFDPTRLAPFIRENHFGLLDIDYAQRLVMISLRSTDPSVEVENQQSGNLLHTDSMSSSATTSATRRMKQATAQRADEQYDHHIFIREDDDSESNVLASIQIPF